MANATINTIKIDETTYDIVDSKVAQEYSEADNSYPVLLSSVSGTTDKTSRGETTTILNNSIYANPLTGALTAAKIIKLGGTDEDILMADGSTKKIEVLSGGTFVKQTKTTTESPDILRPILISAIPESMNDDFISGSGEALLAQVWIDQNSGSLSSNGSITARSLLAVGGEICALTKNTDGSVTTKFSVASATGNTAVAGTLGVTGATTLKNNLAIKNSSNTDKFTVASATGNTIVGGTLNVTGATTLTSLSTTGNTSVAGTLGVTGATTLTSLSTTGNTSVAGTLDVTGATILNDRLTVGIIDESFDYTKPHPTTLQVNGALKVTGTSKFSDGVGFYVGDAFKIFDNTSEKNTVEINRNLIANNGLTVNGDTLFTKSISIEDETEGYAFGVDGSTGNTDIGGNLIVGGSSILYGNFSINNQYSEPKFSANTEGNTTVGGTLGVIGATTLNDTLTVGTSSSNKATTLNGTLDVTGVTTLSDKVIFNGTLAIQDANNPAGVQATYGSNGQVLMSNGSESGRNIYWGNVVPQNDFSGHVSQKANNNYFGHIKLEYDDKTNTLNIINK